MIAFALLLVFAAGIAAVFVLYPLLLAIRCALGRPPPPLPAAGPDSSLPTVTLIVVARNAATLLDRKLANCLALDYPPDKLSFVFYSDGSTDATPDRLRECAENPCIHAIVAPEHAGKIAGLNRSVLDATGDILVFSDVDAGLDPGVLRLLVRHFADPTVGGVCGRRVIGEQTHLKDAQDHHIRFSTLIQTLESRIGSVTSSEGKLYAMRRELYEPIAPAVTDDLYACLCVVRQGYRFLFEPAAEARVPLPSRSLRHELVRRRRIVSTSLRGISRQGVLLNPFRYGLFSLGLWINKILRRLLTVLLLGVFVCNAMLLGPWHFNLLFLLQLGFYSLFAVHLLFLRLQLRLPLVSKLASTVAYFVVGNVASFIGVLEFVAGRRVHGWDPVKSSGAGPAAG